MRHPLGSLARPALRRRQWNVRSTRFASSNSNAAVENAQKKAQEALAGAQKTATKLVESSQKYLGPTLGRLLGPYKDTVIFNLSVARELVKQVYVAEGLQPPTNVETIRAAYQTLWSRASSLPYWRGVINSGEILRIGVLGLEAYGIFKIGEIIGRRSLVGYNLHD